MPGARVSILDPVRLASGLVLAIALAAFTIRAAVNGNAEFIFYGVVLVLLTGVVVAFDLRVRFSTPAIVGLLVWAVLHLAGGNVPIGQAGVLYNFRPWPALPKYDQALHFFGFAVSTLVCWECLGRAIARGSGSEPAPTTGLVVACVLMSVGLGALNEVVEFVAVLTIPNTNVGGYANTGWDLVSNLAGAAAMGAIIRWRG